MTLAELVRSSDSLRGILCMLLSGFFLSSNDAITKWLVPNYPPGEILFMQAVLIASLVSLWMYARAERLWQINHWRAHVYRGLLYALASFAFVNALAYLPLVEVVAIVFAGPLFMTLLGRFLLKEYVGPHRLMAVVIGFVGVIVIIRPGSSAMHWAAILPLFVALADALRDIVTRRMTVGESSKRIVLTTAIILALAGLCTSVSGWQDINPADYIWFILSACCFVIAHYFMIEAFRHAQIVVVAPFKYMQLLWSILAGLAFWGEFPDVWTFVGIGIISASGIYIAWREAMLGKRSLGMK